MLRTLIRSRLTRVLAASAVLLLAQVSASSAATPATKCQSGKNKAAGKYAACRHNAEAKLATNGDGAAHTAALGKCANKYAGAWQKLELKAGGACPSNGDESGVANVTNQCTSNVATELAGGALTNCPADLTLCEGDLATCEAALAGATGQPLKTGQTACYDESGGVIPCNGTGQDGEFQKGLTRSYTDNGDGTITDDRTGLMWEKNSNDGGINAFTVSYTWPNAFSKIATLNSTTFAGYSDWRLPNIGELRTLVDPASHGPATDPAFDTGCTSGCSVTTCSCSANATYWSSTTYTSNPAWAWWVHFPGGDVQAYLKTDTHHHVRAVRGG